MHELAKPASSSVPRFVPAAQLTQKLCPSASWYLPTSHATQSDSLSELSAPTYFPAPHAMHECRPANGWYRPTAHSVQSCAPAALYFPAPHCTVHVPLLSP